MELRVGDYGYDINFTVKDANGVVVDLTSILEIVFLVAEIESERNALSGACIVVNPASGTCKYTVQDGDFDKAGNFNSGIRLKYSASKYVTTQNLYLTVVSKLTA